MSNKYRNFGFRRDKNLSDALSPSEALSNLLNDLPTVEGETFIPEDIYVINGLSNTNVTRGDILSLSGITPLVIDPEDMNTQPQPLRPYLTIKDRKENYALITGKPPFGTGGDGIKAIAIPQSDINQDIDETTTGDDIYDTTSDNIIGPYYFWDNGFFQFGNRVNNNLPELGGMIQWEGYFSPDFFKDQNRIVFSTTGFILIEENPSDTPDGWITRHFIYSKSKQITADGDGTQKSTFFVGDDIIYAAVNQTIDEYSNNSITDIDDVNQTITLENPITLPSGSNTLTLNTVVGNFTNNFEVIINSLQLNDKIKVRFTIWWPDEDILSLKIFSANYTDSEGTGEFFFTYFYTEVDQETDFSEQSIKYYNDNVYNRLNDSTDNDFVVENKLLATYQPPLNLSDKIIYPNKETATYIGNYIIESDGLFSDVNAGDWIVNRSDGDVNFKVYKIVEVINSSRVGISKDEVEPSTSIPAEFDFSIVKNIGLVGIYPYNNGTITTNDLRFRTFRIIEDNLVCNLSSTSNTDFFRVQNLDNQNVLTVDDFQNTSQTFNNGFICVYQDKALDDRSKQVFCEGVFSKTVSMNVASGSNAIMVNDVSDLQTGLYVQYENYIPNGTTITNIDSGTNIITISNNTTNSIVQGSTITISPDSVNREICNIPLNTAPPFEGTLTGLKTTSSSQGVWVNTLEFDELEIKTNDAAGLIQEVETGTLEYTRTVDINVGGNTYKLIGKQV